MKQYITIEQLNELSKKGKEKLRREFRHKEGEIWNEDIICRWFSIGQMIEFLKEKSGNEFFILTNATLTAFKNKGWKVTTGNKGEEPDCETKGYKEPIDSLWQAVKEILEK